MKVLIFLLSFSAFAQEIVIENLDVKLDQGLGKASADKYIFPGQFESQGPVSMDLEKRGDELLAITGQGTFTFILPGLDTLDVEELNLKEEYSHINLNADHLKTQDLQVYRPFLKCPGQDFSDNLLDSILEECTKNMEFSIYDLRSSKRVSDLRMNTKNHDFKLSAYVKEGWGYNVSAQGKSYFDRPNRLLTLQVDEVRAYGLDVSDKFWEAVEDQSNPAILIQKPVIFIYLDML